MHATHKFDVNCIQKYSYLCTVKTHRSMPPTAYTIVYYEEMFYNQSTGDYIRPYC